MIMSRLKAETQAYHDRIEHDRLSRELTAMEVDLGYYTQVLAIYYGFYAPLEARLIGAARWDALGFDLIPRLKTPLLVRDLAHFGIEGERLRALPACADLPQVADLPAAIGCLYVLEGATLGGQLISRHLAGTLGVGPESGTAFFSSYGPTVGPMWKAFRAFVEEYAPGSEEAIIAGACATFTSLGRWFHEGYARIVIGSESR